MKKVLKLLGLLVLTIPFLDVFVTHAQVANYVPDYYYANYKFIDDWDAIRSGFNMIKTRFDLGMEIDSSAFSDLNKHFQNSFKYLPQKFSSVYEKCTLLSESMSNGYSYTDLKAFLGNSCYKQLTQTVSTINNSYTVKASATATPTAGMAPLTVTFDARGSVDPSQETLPVAKFFWYYRDENEVDIPMGEGQVINYTFPESGRFVVHLVIRSSNVDEGILDGEKNMVINVSPKAANIVVYANTRKMEKNSVVKIGSSEGKKGVVFDGSATMPRGGRRIMSHKWTIVNSEIGYSYSKSGSGKPSYINVPLDGNGEYKVTLTTVDNEKNSVSETFSLFISDPVSLMKRTPTKGTTSSTYTFDGSASYSLASKINTYFRSIFNENGDKIKEDQGKKMSYIFRTPGNYIVKLSVTNLRGESNEDIRDIYVESTRPKPQFTITPTKRRTKPSEFTFDAYATDIDVKNGVDVLRYERTFSPDNVTIISAEDFNSRVVAQFNEVGKYSVQLKVTDQYGKTAYITKDLQVESILRPEIEINPGPVTRGEPVQFKATINEQANKIIDYKWLFGDGTTRQSQFITDVEHRYGKKGIYTVTLTVTNEKGNTNTIKEKMFVGETEYPIAAYRIKDGKGFYIPPSDVCKVKTITGGTVNEEAYPINRGEKLTVNAGISVSTKGDAVGLSYVYEPEGTLSATPVSSSFSHRFPEMGCHYIDLAVKDQNIGKQDKVRIRFNVKNALPTIKDVLLTFPQYADDNFEGIGVDTSSMKQEFDCAGTSNLTIKVTAVEPKDSDGNISRLRFYYYNVDDPSRILEYKEAMPVNPYAYFVIPRYGGEYAFGVMVYDNDGGVISTRDYLGSAPSVFFPASCDDTDVPMVTLVESANNIQVGDKVTYTIKSKISSNNEDFETDRTFYYDFTGDGVWDLVTKRDTATYTFMEPYEDGVKPRAAVEYRKKIGSADGGEIIVKKGIKPILFTNSYKNTVIFRDLSVGDIQQREICFNKEQCELGNSKYKKATIVTDIESIGGNAQNAITKNDGFIQRYPSYGIYDVTLYLKNKYGISVETGFEITTSENTKNGRIAPGINMITIPETTFNNSIPEIFLSKEMKNSLLIYINNEGEDTCFVDTDVSRDSDQDGESDNDADLPCNTLRKILYDANYDSAIGRVYFMNNGQLVFQNFYVTFEGYQLELDDENMSIYNDITTLINGIEDTREENTDLKNSLDILRKNLNNRNLVSSTVLTIKNQISEGGISIDAKQKDLLYDILNRLENEDTIIATGLNEYEKNKQEILTMLPAAWRGEIEELFSKFEENVDNYDAEGKANELKNIWNAILSKGNEKGGLDDSDMSLVIQPSFCNIFEYYEISSYSKTCVQNSYPELDSSSDETVRTDQAATTSKGMPTRLKIILIILFSGVLIMGGVIVFFAIKAKMNNSSDEDEG